MNDKEEEPNQPEQFSSPPFLFATEANVDENEHADFQY